MELINGNELACSLQMQIKEEVEKISGRKPCVAFIRIGNDPASISYVNKKQKVASDLSMQSKLFLFEESITQDELDAFIDKLNNDSLIDGILIQAPLPKHLDERHTFNKVNPSKDVDGFNVINIGKVCQEDNSAFVSCTPAGIIKLLESKNIQTAGKHAVVLGRSLIVGKPVSLLLVSKKCNCTLTVCHSRTENLKDILSKADIIIAAIGSPKFVKADMVKQGAVVIDVGINRIKDDSKKSGYRLVGDVDFDEVAPKTSFITPVPGGVGPMTVSVLMQNTLKAYKVNTAKA